MNRLQKNTMTKNRLQDGFTLIELMIIVAILGVLISVAVATRSNKTVLVQAYAKNIYGVFVDAKLEAIRTGQSAIVQIDGRTLKVFIDANGNMQGDELIDGTGERVKPTESDYSNGVLTNTGSFDELYTMVRLPVGVAFSTVFQPVYFNSRGIMNSVATDQPASIVVTVCQEDVPSYGNCVSGSNLSQVTVNMAGVVRIDYNANS